MKKEKQDNYCLISYATTQRTREIGIRKIMGASVEVVMRLLSREMVKLLIISTILSIPAYFGVRAWLQNFAYHINLHLGMYFLVLGVFRWTHQFVVLVKAYSTPPAPDR